MSKTVSNKSKEVAIRFFFPNISMSSIAYRKISKFIDSEFEELGHVLCTS